MASKAKRVRKAVQRASAPRALREPKAAAEPVAVAAVKPKVSTTSEPPERDGLIWLAKLRSTRRLSGLQLREGLHYRTLFHSPQAGGSLTSSVEMLGMGGGGGKGGLPFGGSFDDAQAALELHVIREFVLGGEADMILVMDGVCGQGWTLRYLAKGDRHRADQLETALRIALNLMANNRRAKDKAMLRERKAA